MAKHRMGLRERRKMRAWMKALQLTPEEKPDFKQWWIERSEARG